MDAKKLKLIVKGEKKPTFGTDPNEPWSARVGITESERSELHAYLKSRGINPDFVSKDTKISHAKSSEFHKWRRDHQFDDPINFVSTTAADRMKQQRAQTEEVQAEAWDNSATKIKKSLRGGTYNVKPTALDKFRAAAAERAKKHDAAEKEMKARHAAGKEDMKGSIDRLEKQLNKEEKSEHKVGDSVTVNSKFFGKQKGKVTKVDNQSVHVVRDGKSSSEKYPHDAVVKEAAGISKQKETSFHKKLDTLVHNTFGKRKDELKMKEEVVTEKNDSHTHAAHYEDPKTGEWTGMNLLIAKDDDDAIRQANEKCKEGCRLTKVERHITVKEEAEQIDELKKSTVFSWLKQQPVVPEKKPGMSRKDHNQKIKTHSKSWNRALDRLSGYKPTSEDVFQDTQAATQTPFDMGTQADDREPVYSKKKEMSKSARIIKSLYKKNRMVKEDLYDHEKEDKSVASYGKKPKVEKQEVYGDENSQAAMILKGGTTLTGQPRDTLEIDPVMRKPVKPDNQISNKKTDK